MSREMKDSGIAWIGEIPKGWNTCQVKNIFVISRGRVIPITDMDDSFQFPVYSSQTKDNGCMGYISTYDYFGEALTWTTDGANAGTIFYRKGYFNCTNVCGILQLKKNNSWMNYMLYSVGLSAFNCRRADTNGYKIMSNEMAEIKVIVPPLPEQQKIAEFLDRKCGEIDELVALQEKMIEELKAYKQSVITEAVTKGLNPNAPMKDSGIAWIGEIPEHWEVKPLKWDFEIIAGATPKTDNIDFWDGNIPWVTPADYKTEDVYIEKGKRFLSEKGVESCATTLLPKNSIIFSKRAPIGLVVVNSQPLCTNQGCLGCIPKQDIVKYFYYVISVFTEQYELYGSGTTFKEISANNFANFKLPFPNATEQQQIADYLDKKCAKIDELVAVKQQKIETLKEYKKSLIYEYVTGKKEVI